MANVKAGKALYIFSHEHVKRMAVEGSIARGHIYLGAYKRAQIPTTDYINLASGGGYSTREISYNAE